MNFTAIPLHRTSFLLIGLLAASMLTFAACDSNGGGNTDAVVGVYEFTRFQFGPSSSAFTTINMLNELEAAEIEFFNDGTYSFRYRFEGENSRSLRGSFSRDGQNIRLSGEDNDAAQYRTVLLPRRFELRIEDGDQVNRLRADFSHAFPAAALREYRPDEYEGVNGEVDGEVQLTLERRF